MHEVVFEKNMIKSPFYYLSKKIIYFFLFIHEHFGVFYCHFLDNVDDNNNNTCNRNQLPDNQIIMIIMIIIKKKEKKLIYVYTIQMSRFGFFTFIFLKIFLFPS